MDVGVILIISLLAIIIFLVWQNNNIVTTALEYENDKLPNDFSEYRILQISDFHNKQFGLNQNRVLKHIKNASPNIIVITGDLVDRRHTNVKVAMEFIEGAIKLAPIYYVPGNHEGMSEIYNEISKKLAKLGVCVLNNKKIQLKINNSIIQLIGLKDPSFEDCTLEQAVKYDNVDKKLKALCENDASFKILLSHRPDLFNMYARNNVDLVFSGHAHGGQFRVPFIGGLFAPNQGFFPKYTSGMHAKDTTTMVVSRGMGNSTMPIRIFNRPEVVVVTLKN